MADNKPGLSPRKLEGEVDIKVESDRLPVETTVEEKPSVAPVKETQAEDNTPAPATDTKDNEQVAEEQPITTRENNRIQSVIAERDQERAARLQAEAMLQRVVNVQVQQPVVNESELLAKQYRTYNSALGYPEDPKEYTAFTEQRARLAAADEARKQQVQFLQQQETSEFLRAFPNAQNDPLFMGAVAAQKAEAQRRGSYLTFKDAGEIVEKELEARATKKVVSAKVQNDAEKDEAYVESTRGSSSNRGGSTPDLDNMSTQEKEEWLKKTGNW